MTNVARQILAVAAGIAQQQPRRARLLVAMACAASGDSRRQRISRVEKRFAKTIKRNLEYARHETLRRLERRNRSPSSIFAAAEDHTGRALRIVFDIYRFAQDFIDALRQEHMDAVQTAGDEMFQELGRSDPWERPAQATIDFVNARANLLRNVPDEIWTTIRDQIAEGIDQGESVRDLSKRITATFSDIQQGRGNVIAVTETHAAYGFSRLRAMQDAGIKFKKWVTSALPSVRPWHQEAEGQVVPIDTAFSVGPEQLMYPGDPVGSPENVINCRCILIPVEEPISSADSPSSSQSEIRIRGERMAERMDFPKDKIDWYKGDPVEFKVGERRFIRGGAFFPNTGRILIDVNRIENPVSVDAIMAHEISHAQYHAVQQRQEIEHAAIKKLIENDAEFKRLFTAGGFPRPEAMKELAQKFPVSAALSRTWGDAYLSQPEESEGNWVTINGRHVLIGGPPKTKEMMKDDGVSDYSKAYWEKEAREKSGGLSRAVDETLAEVQAWQATGASHLSRPSRDWEQFARDVRISYKRIQHPYQEISKWEK